MRRRAFFILLLQILTDAFGVVFFLLVYFAESIIGSNNGRNIGTSLFYEALLLPWKQMWAGLLLAVA